MIPAVGWRVIWGALNGDGTFDHGEYPVVGWVAHRVHRVWTESVDSVELFVLDWKGAEPLEEVDYLAEKQIGDRFTDHRDGSYRSIILAPGAQMNLAALEKSVRARYAKHAEREASKAAAPGAST